MSRGLTVIATAAVEEAPAQRRVGRPGTAGLARRIRATAWILAAVVGWLVCLLLCWRMGRETGRRGLHFGVLGPPGVVLLAFLPPRKRQSAVVRRLESMGLLGLRIRRETLAGANFTGMQGGWRQQIEEDVTPTEGAGGTRRRTEVREHLPTGPTLGDTFGVDRARRHQKLLARLSLGLLALVAELAGRSLTHRLDVGRHVGPVSYSHHDYYPFLLAAVKVGIALMLARVAWRFAKATQAARAARRLTGGGLATRTPRARIELSPRLWLAAFLGTATIYLVQTDTESLAAGRWPPLAPWLHTSALPVFAVLAVLVAVVYRAVESWLADVERIAADAVALARRLVGRAAAPAAVRPARDTGDHGPRRIFGLAFESRPPPLAA